MGPPREASVGMASERLGDPCTPRAAQIGVKIADQAGTSQGEVRIRTKMEADKVLDQNERSRLDFRRLLDQVQFGELDGT